MNLLARWLLNALAIFVAGYLLKGIHITNFTAALAAALVLGIVNVAIKPFLQLLMLPFSLVTFGLVTFIVNACMIYISSILVPGFSVDNYVWAVLFSLFLAVVNYFLYQMFD